jgi:glucokinase
LIGNGRTIPPGGGIVAAVDWGGTWIRAALATPDGELLARLRHRRPSEVSAQCGMVAQLVGDLIDHDGQQPRALAVGIAGIVRRGQVHSAVNLGIRRPLDLVGALRTSTGLPVHILNDTQAAALAEAAGRGAGMTVLLTVGTGIGGAIVSDGTLITGGGAAGDFGHMTMSLDGPACACGGRGCLEQLVSGRVLDDTARELAASGASPWLTAQARAYPPRTLHAGDLDDAARDGDPVALDALQQAAAILAAALRSVVAATDADSIVLAGGLMAGGRLLPELVRQRWPGERPSWSGAELQPAALGDDAGLRGAALFAAAHMAADTSSGGRDGSSAG